MDEWDHEFRGKRGGPGVSQAGRERRQVAPAGDPASLRGFRRREEPLDQLDSDLLSPVELTSAKLDYERLTEHLKDPVLRTILTMRIEQRTRLEIAKALGKPLSFVASGLRSIRSIWDKINPGSP